MKTLIVCLLLSCMVSTAQATEERIVTTDGVDLYVKIKGKGTPCLYIHGGPGSGSYWFEKFFGDFMEQHFTVIYLDQRGVGRSTSPADGNYSLNRMVQDFEEVRTALGIDQWVTMGHSFAGILQMGYAKEYPDSHKGMIMVNCTLDINESFCESWSPKAAEFLGITDNPTCANDTLPLMDRMGGHIFNLREKGLFWKMAYEDQKYDSIMEATYKDIPNYNYDFSNAAFSHREYWHNYKPETAAVTMPVLFFYGERDWMVGPNHYKGINFPNMILWNNKGGHIPFLENKEDLGKAILEYKNTYKI